MRRLIDIKKSKGIEGLTISSATVGIDRTFLKRLVWLYFWLLILEGALRKWALPSLSNPLLIVRDPVMILIWWQAAHLKLIPKSPYLTSFYLLFTLCAFLGLAQVAAGLVPFYVYLFGLRCFFLHVPLIFILPQVYTSEDLKSILKWIIIISIPMTILMLQQFRSPPDAWINRTVGLGEGRQLDSALGKIRPPGTFSFITGTVAFYAIVTAGLCYAVTKSNLINKALLVSAVCTTGIALVVSGSRSALLASVLVLVFYLLAIFYARKAASGVIRLAVVVAIGIFILGQNTHFEEGRIVLETRFSMAANTEKEQGGMLGRFMGQLINPVMMLIDVPLLGHGMGVGTNVGAKFITGNVGFLLSEGEWGRMVLELGSVVGLLMILFRLSLCVWLAKASYQSAKSGHVLPFVLLGACVTNLFNGQWGQPTTLGFSVFSAGLCLAAAVNPDKDILKATEAVSVPISQRPRFGFAHGTSSIKDKAG